MKVQACLKRRKGGSVQAVCGSWDSNFPVTVWTECPSWKVEKYGLPYSGASPAAGPYTLPLVLCNSGFFQSCDLSWKNYMNPLLQDVICSVVPCDFCGSVVYVTLFHVLKWRYSASVFHRLSSVLTAGTTDDLIFFFFFFKLVKKKRSNFISKEKSSYSPFSNNPHMCCITGANYLVLFNRSPTCLQRFVWIKSWLFLGSISKYIRHNHCSRNAECEFWQWACFLFFFFLSGAQKASHARRVTKRLAVCSGKCKKKSVLQWDWWSRRSLLLKEKNRDRGKKKQRADGSMAGSGCKIVRNTWSHSVLWHTQNNACSGERQRAATSGPVCHHGKARLS